MARNTYVRIGEAARLAGVSVDTLRRWERDGKLSAVRTFGGQRTYSLTDIEQLRDDSAPVADFEVPEHAQNSAPQPQSPPSVQPWKAREANAAADLSVTRLKIERREELRAYRREEQRRVATEYAQAEARIAEARLNARREAALKDHREALDSALRFIRMRLISEPPDVRADIEGFLAEEAIPGASVEWINARVEAILDRHRAERIAEAQRIRDKECQKQAEASREASETLRRTLLLSHAEMFARRLTADRDEWEAASAEEALDEVRDILAEAIEANWSEKRVEREVRALLSAWD